MLVGVHEQPVKPCGGQVNTKGGFIGEQVRHDETGASDRH
jgi:hypothetical protein